VVRQRDLFRKLLQDSAGDPAGAATAAAAAGAITLRAATPSAPPPAEACPAGARPVVDAAWACRQITPRVFGHCTGTLTRAATHVPCHSRRVRLAGGWPLPPHPCLTGTEGCAGSGTCAASMQFWQVLWR